LNQAIGYTAIEKGIFSYIWVKLIEYLKRI
jgi:hypothetical protein